MKNQKPTVEQIQLGLEKGAGWCHNADGEEVHVSWLTVRSTYEQFPGGVVTGCEFKDGKLARYLGSACFLDTEREILDHLAKLSEWNAKWTDKEFQTEIFVAKKDELGQILVTIVAATEREAAKAAAHAGYYVNQGNTYPGVDQVPHHKGAVWRKLAFGEFEYSEQHTD